MKNKNFLPRKELIKPFLLFCIGFCAYITIEIIFRGYSYPLMGLIGALAFIIIDTLNNKISWNIPLVVQMLIGSFVITLLELFAGIYSRSIMNIAMWDYSNEWGNFMGLICPLFSFLWFLLSLVAIILADAVNYYILHENPRPYYKGLRGNILFKLPKNACI